MRHLALLGLLCALLAGCATPTAGQASPASLTGPTTSQAPVGVPQRISIPALHVDAPIVPVGLDPAGALEVPDVHEVGWYTASPHPGETGPALLAGHVNWSGTPGAFARLAQLNAGDEVTVATTTGPTSFRVTSVTTQPKTGIDWRQVLADRPDPELVLVTCGGRLDHATRSYESNVIARAVRV